MPTQPTSVIILGSAYDLLQQLAKIKGKTESEVLVDAIALMNWFEVTQKKSRILVEDKGKFRQINSAP
jgi:hypothetical protein